MYSYIKGQLAEVIDENHIVVENHGIGYDICVPATLLETLPEIGAEIKIYTYLHVKEDIFMLYGFLSPDDRKVFKLLIGVSGIGPKGALGILSVMSADTLRFAVLSEDAKAIAKAPGVGGKTAQRVIIELKDKLSLEEAFELKTGHVAADAGKDEVKGKKKEAVDALVSLGYASSEALKVLSGIEIAADSTVEEILKQALKSMAFL